MEEVLFPPPLNPHGQTLQAFSLYAPEAPIRAMDGEEEHSSENSHELLFKASFTMVHC